MEQKIKDILHQWSFDLLQIGLNRSLSWLEARQQQEELYEKLLEKINIILK